MFRFVLSSAFSKMMTHSNDDGTSEYRVCSLEEIMENMNDCDDDGFLQPEEYVPSSLPVLEETIPDDFFDENDIASTPSVYKEGDISKLLNELPNCLSDGNGFPKSWHKAPKPRKHPDIILDDKIPILLSEKFFKFNNMPEQHSAIASCSNGNSSNMGQRFPTVFSDSDEDNSTVQLDLSQVAAIQPEQKPINGSNREYYNPFEVYMNKRGKNHTKKN